MCPLNPFPPSSPPHPSWVSPSTGFGSLCQTSNSIDPLSGTCRLLGNGHFFLFIPMPFGGDMDHGFRPKRLWKGSLFWEESKVKKVWIA